MDEYTLDRLKELFARSPGPCPIAFDLLNPDGSAATLRSKQRVRPMRSCSTCRARNVRRRRRRGRSAESHGQPRSANTRSSSSSSEVEELQRLSTAATPDGRPRTRARRDLPIAPRVLHPSGRLAAHAARAPSAAALHARFRPPALHRFLRTARRPRLWRRPGHRRRLRALSRPPGAGHRPPEGPRHQAAPGAQFRPGQAGRLSQGAAPDAPGGQVRPADLHA